EVPDADRAVIDRRVREVFAGGDQLAAVAREGDRDRRAVGRRPREAAHQRAGGDGEQPVGGGDALAVGGERQAGGGAGVRDGARERAVGGAPQVDRAGRARGDGGAVGRPRGGVHAEAVAHRAHERAVGGAPHAREAIGAGGGDRRAVGREGDALGAVRVAGGEPQLRAVAHAVHGEVERDA